MELLLDHMLGKAVQRCLNNLGFKTSRVYEIGFHNLTNGDLYKKACEKEMILITCDSDYDDLKIGEKGKNSIIYLKPKPTNAIKYLIPFLNDNFPEEIVDKYKTDHLILIENGKIEFHKFQ